MALFLILLWTTAISTTLDLNGNQLEGKLPASLVNCKMLEILDIGNNQIYDTFPCSLHIISRLRVLVLRSNKFHGTIGCVGTNSTWPVLQIIDLAGNNFTGNLPHEQFLTWKAMMVNALLKLHHLQFESEQYSRLYYQNPITITGKGREMQLVKIQVPKCYIFSTCHIILLQAKYHRLLETCNFLSR